MPCQPNFQKEEPGPETHGLVIKEAPKKLAKKMTKTALAPPKLAKMSNPLRNSQAASEVVYVPQLITVKHVPDDKQVWHWQYRF